MNTDRVLFIRVELRIETGKAVFYHISHFLTNLVNISEDHYFFPYRLHGEGVLRPQSKSVTGDELVDAFTT